MELKNSADILDNLGKASNELGKVHHAIMEDNHNGGIDLFLRIAVVERFLLNAQSYCHSPTSPSQNTTEAAMHLIQTAKDEAQRQDFNNTNPNRKEKD